LRDITTADLGGGDVIGILDAMEIPIVVVALDCTVTRVNRAAVEALGVSASDIGRRTCDVPALGALQDIEQTCMQVMADGVPSRREVRNGDRWFLLHIVPYSGANQSVHGAVLTFTNVTAFRASIAQAVYEREYTKAILNAGIDPLVVLDESLHVQTANRAFYDWFGLARERAQGIPLRTLGDTDWKESDLWLSLKSTVTEGREFQTVEVEADFPSKGRRTVLLDARRLARDGQALLLVAFRDITERRNLYVQLQEANETKMKFLASMSHELRTPLNAILGYTDLLTLGIRGPLPDAQKADIARITGAARYLLGLINDILNFTRLEAGQIELAVGPVVLSSVLDRARDLVAQAFADKGLQLHGEPTSDALIVEADAERMQQILLNLLTNAMKFTPEGGTVSLATDADETMVHIHVRDTGCGIPVDQHERIFEPFVQLGRASRDGGRGGVGLGLAISRDLARRMKGDLIVRSQSGTGSDFVLSLPRPTS
jgi:PAS domain S-box-containing protein